MLYVTQSLMLTRLMHTNSHWQQWVDSLEIKSVIRDMECASLCNNSSPDYCSCLKFCLEDTKVHQIILHCSKGLEIAKYNSIQTLEIT